MEASCLGVMGPFVVPVRLFQASWGGVFNREKQQSYEVKCSGLPCFFSACITRMLLQWTRVTVRPLVQGNCSTVRKTAVDSI